MAYFSDQAANSKAGSLSKLDTEQKQLKNSSTIDSWLIWKFYFLPTQEKDITAESVKGQASSIFRYLFQLQGVLQDFALQVCNRKQMTGAAEMLKEKKRQAQTANCNRMHANVNEQLGHQ